MIFTNIAAIKELLDSNINTLSSISEHFAPSGTNTGVCGFVETLIKNPQLVCIGVLQLSSIAEIWADRGSYSTIYPIGGIDEYNASHDAGTLWQNPRRLNYLKHMRHQLQKLREAFDDKEFCNVYMRYHVANQVLLYKGRIIEALTLSCTSKEQRFAVLKNLLGVHGKTFSYGFCRLLDTHDGYHYDATMHRQRVDEWLDTQGTIVDVNNVNCYPVNLGDTEAYGVECKNSVQWLNEKRWDYIKFMHGYYKQDLRDLMRKHTVVGLLTC